MHSPNNRLSRWKAGRFAAGLLMLALVILMVSPAYAGIRYITSLPDTITTADNFDTIIVNVDNLSADRDAIVFASNVHDVVLDLNNKRVNFGVIYTGTTGTSPMQGPIGLNLRATGIYNILVKNGFIIHNAPDTVKNTPSLHTWAAAVRHGSGGRNITYDNVYFRVFGRNSKILYDGANTYNILFNNCKFDDSMRSFGDRQYWIDNAMIVSASHNTIEPTWTDFDYHIAIRNCSTICAHWTAFYLHGSNTVADIYNNYIVVDGRNDLGSSFPTSAAQRYAISVRGDPGAIRVKIRNNRIRSGTDFLGGRGIFIAEVDGMNLRHPDSCLYIYGNDMIVHQGYDGEEATVNGILIRQANWSNIWVDSNSIVCIGDTVRSTSAIDIGPMSGFRLTGPGSDLIIERNHVKMYYTTGFTPHYGTSNAHGACIMFDEFHMNLPNIVIRNNVFESESVAIRWGFFNGHGGNVTMDNCTYRAYTGGRNLNDNYTFYLGYGAGSTHHAYNNVIRNGNFEGNMYDTSIFMDDNEPDSLSIGLRVTLQVNVIGNNGKPVTNADVWVTNNYNAVVAQGSTGGSGRLVSDVTYWWECNAAVGVADSTNFNPFRIKAKKGSDSTLTNYQVRWNAKSVNITLQNTAGSDVADSVPPGRINNLGAAPGFNAGEVFLSWTAPGDDGYIGTAAQYDLRYSSSAISDGNWASATPFTGEPVPMSAGVSQSVLMSGLTPGQTYYFAIKSLDEIGNTSVLSNVPSARAQDSISLGEDDFQAVLVSPVSHAVVNTTKPTLMVRNLEIPGDVNFFFEVATDSFFLSTAVLSPAVPQDAAKASTAWKIDSSLAANTTYFWRAKANDYSYSDVASFTIEPAVHAYPNPFKPSRGQVATFTEIPESSSLMIMSVSGAIIRQFTNIIGGEVTWDGKNSDGNPVASGSYLWQIEGTDMRGKILLIR
ncbi:MAG: hypothetical protein HRF51_06030 [bacterium]